jgi:hypothetical protein
MLQPDSIVVEVVKQPPITPEISYGSVLASAVGVLGIIFAAGVIVGILVGVFVVWRKKRLEATEPVDHTHVKLRLS